jgi:hypothetical protein
MKTKDQYPVTKQAAATPADMENVIRVMTLFNKQKINSIDQTRLFEISADRLMIYKSELNELKRELNVFKGHLKEFRKTKNIKHLQAYFADERTYSTKFFYRDNEFTKRQAKKIVDEVMEEHQIPDDLKAAALMLIDTRIQEMTF